MPDRRYLNWPLLGGLVYVAALILCGFVYARTQWHAEDMRSTGISLVRQDPQEIELSVRGTGMDSRTRAYLTLDAANQRAVVNQLPVWGQALDVAVVGNRLYLVQGNKGLKIFDLSLPAAPEALGVWEASQKPWRLDMDDSRLYLSAMRQGLRAYSLAGETLLFSLATQDSSYMSVHRGRHLYIADGHAGLAVCDVSNYVNSREVSRLPLAGVTVDLAFYEDYLLAASMKGGLSLIDIRDPAQPKVVQNLGRDKAYQKLVVVAGYVYAADSDRQIDVYRVGADKRLVFKASLPLFGRIGDFLLDGTYLYLAESSHGVSRLDISDPERPRRVGKVGTSGSPRSLAIYDNYLYVASDTRGVQVVDIRRLENDHLPASVDTPGQALQVVADGRWLYVADGEGGFQVVDRSERSRMKLVAGGPTSSLVNRIAKQGSHLFVADTGQGLLIYDVSSPIAPRLLSRLQIGVGMSDMLVRGNNLFATSVQRRLLRIDISDPQHPWLAESIDLPGRAWRLAASGDDILVAAEKAGLQIVRFDGQKGGRLIGSLSQPWPMSAFSLTIGVAVRDDYAYLVQGDQGLLVVDISDPENPREVALLNIPGQTLDIGLSESFAAVSTRWQGYCFLDISDPGRPHLAAKMYLPRVKTGFVVEGGVLYSPRYTSGVSVLPLPLRARNLSAGADISVVFPSPEFAGWYDLSLSGAGELISESAVLEVR